MDIRFDGKRALVTGAGKGIGRRIAERLAEFGAEVIAVSRTQADLDDLTKTNPNIKTLKLDVSDWAKTKEALRSIGPIDLLVNNAAIALEGMIGDISEEDCDKMFNVNVKAVVNISQEIFNGMKERGQGGSIVNVSSIGSIRAFPTYAMYSASKGALDQLTRNMACEFGPYNIRVNAVNPTAIRTRMAEAFFDPKNAAATAMKENTPLRRFGEVDDVAYPVLFLLSDKATLVTGISMVVDGGVTICV